MKIDKVLAVRAGIRPPHSSYFQHLGWLVNISYVFGVVSCGRTVSAEKLIRSPGTPLGIGRTNANKKWSPSHPAKLDLEISSLSLSLSSSTWFAKSFKMAPRARFELATLRLTAEAIKNLSALSGVAYKKWGAVPPLLLHPHLHPHAISGVWHLP